MFTMSEFMYCYNYFTGIVIFTITVIFQIMIIVGKKIQYRPSPEHTLSIFSKGVGLSNKAHLKLLSKKAKIKSS